VVKEMKCSVLCPEKMLVSAANPGSRFALPQTAWVVATGTISTHLPATPAAVTLLMPAENLVAALARAREITAPTVWQMKMNTWNFNAKAAIDSQP
jgi:hypothetical protein